MRIKKQSHVDNNVAKKINKLNSSPRFIAKEISLNKSPLIKESIMNKVQIKVKLAQDIESNPIFIQKNPISKKNDEKNELNTNQENMESAKSKKNENINDEKSNQKDIYKLKKLLISPKINRKEISANKINIRKNENIYDKEDNYDVNTYNQNDIQIRKNILTHNFPYNKPKRGSINIFKNSGLKNNNKGLYTENNEGKEFNNNKKIQLNDLDNKEISSSGVKKYNILHSPKINMNIDLDNINNVKNYGINTYVQKNVNIFDSNRINTSPLRLRNNSNHNINNNFNMNNNFNYNINYLNLNQNIQNNKYEVNLKLDDLILFEERLSDIIIALTNYQNINDCGASNECTEFFVFYFHSSLKYIFPYFFNGKNKTIIQSAINLKLFAIIITYHLSMNPVLLTKLLDELKEIFSLAKMNLYLFIKKIQLFYGESYIKQNDMYFKTFNIILKKNGLFNYNERQITEIINKNCYEIVRYLYKILEFYYSIENNYYQDFLEIFNSISKISEKDINNYFYNYLYVNSTKGAPHPKYTFQKKGIKNEIYYEPKKNIEKSPNRINNYSGNMLRRSERINQENPIILEYQKNKATPPFLKEPNTKKFTLVLDLDETLVNVDDNGVCNLRPGIFSFFNAIKQYYEIVSFTNGDKIYSDSIIRQIEARTQYFDYNLFREHSLLNGNEFVKDISRLGRDMKKIIIVDNDPNNFKLNKDNAIQIAPYYGELSKNDTVLFELKKLLILFHKNGYEDLRLAIKDYSQDIKYNVTKVSDE